MSNKPLWRQFTMKSTKGILPADKKNKIYRTLPKKEYKKSAE
jgi:hypothetical protein